MSKVKDRTGERYGRLTVLSLHEIRKDAKGRSKTYWKCRCDCGNEKNVSASALESGATKSCGCYRNEQIAKAKSLIASEKYGNERIEICGNKAYIRLTGTEDKMICDLDDLEMLKKSTWAKNAKGYAKCRKKTDGKMKTVLAHRLVMNALKGQIVDHINRNRLDNRKSNLRIVDTKANRVHAELRPGNNSGYAGVERKKNSWVAMITIDGKYSVIGRFPTKEEAIKARRKAEMDIYGVYSNENYIE